MEMAAAIAKTRVTAPPQEQPQDAFQSTLEGRTAEQITAVLAQIEGQSQNLTGPVAQYQRQQILAEAPRLSQPVPLTWPEARRPPEQPPQGSQACAAGRGALPTGIWALMAALTIVLWSGESSLLWLAWLLAAAVFVMLLLSALRRRT